MIYLFSAYVVVWVLLFVYLWSLSNRQQRLEAELRNVKQALEGRRQQG